MKELLEKRFLWPRTGSDYWVNPSLFFKGDRVLFIKEYRRSKRVEPTRDPHTVDLIDGVTDAERY